MENNLNARYQTLLILWFALLMSIGMFLVLTLFAAPQSQTMLLILPTRWRLSCSRQWVRFRNTFHL